jgi:hypothetical protein
MPGGGAGGPRLLAAPPGAGRLAPRLATRFAFFFLLLVVLRLLGLVVEVLVVELLGFALGLVVVVLVVLLEVLVLVRDGGSSARPPSILSARPWRTQSRASRPRALTRA